MTDELIPDNVRTGLKHYFSVYAGGQRSAMRLGSVTPASAERARELYIAGLTRVLQKLREGKIPEAEGVGESQLQEMLDVAQGDWTQPATIIRIYNTHSRITGEKYDENLFTALK